MCCKISWSSITLTFTLTFFQDGQLRQNSQESFTIEWEEFEVGGPNTSSSAEPSPRKESSHQHMSQHQQSSQHTTHQSSQHYSHQSSQHTSHQFSQHTSHQSQHSAHQSSQQHTHQTNGHAHNTSRDKIDGKEKGARKRRDSWGNPVDDGKSKEGIGKLKISREMREKLEAVTSSHPSR